MHGAAGLLWVSACTGGGDHWVSQLQSSHASYLIEKKNKLPKTRGQMIKPQINGMIGEGHGKKCGNKRKEQKETNKYCGGG